MFIKKIIAFIPCYLFYSMGHLVSKLLNKIPEHDAYEELAHYLYQIYNGLMLWSIWWNDFGQLNIWKKHAS